MKEKVTYSLTGRQFYQAMQFVVKRKLERQTRLQTRFELKTPK
jgi:hypothetical protein